MSFSPKGMIAAAGTAFVTACSSPPLNIEQPKVKGGFLDWDEKTGCLIIEGPDGKKGYTACPMVPPIPKPLDHNEPE